MNKNKINIHSDCIKASGLCTNAKSNLKQDVAVSVSLEKEITLCSVYILPSFTLKIIIWKAQGVPQ